MKESMDHFAVQKLFPVRRTVLKRCKSCENYASTPTKLQIYFFRSLLLLLFRKSFRLKSERNERYLFYFLFQQLDTIIC